MRIGMFTNFYAPSTGGTETSIKSLSEGLRKIENETYILAPIYPKWKDDDKNVIRYKASYVNWKKRQCLIPFPFASKARRIGECLKLDIVHSHYSTYLGHEALKVGYKLDIPVVFTYHTKYENDCNYVPFIPKKISCEILKWLIKKHCRKCDAIIAPSSAAKFSLLSQLNIEKPIYIIPSGIDINRFSKDADRKKEVRNKHFVEDNQVLLVTASRLVPEKNIEFLIRAFAIIRKAKNNVKFMIIGEGNHRSKLEHLVRDLELKNSVIFTGFVNDEDMAAYYHAGDIFVFASLTETQGLVVLEAMASGLPVVAIKADGIEDTIEDGKDGFLTDNKKGEFAQNIIKLVENDNLRKKMSETAKKNSQRFSIEVWVKKITELYQMLIEDKKRRRMV